MSYDLDSMELDELKKLQRDVAKAIDSFQERQDRADLQKLIDLANEHGIPVSRVAALLGASPKARVKGNPKFANPLDPAQVWSGRGRKPLWFTAALESGKTEDDLLI